MTFRRVDMLFIWSPSILLSLLISWATREVLPSLDHFVDFVVSFHFEAMGYFGCLSVQASLPWAAYVIIQFNLVYMVASP